LSIGGGQSRTLRYGELDQVEADLRDDIKRRYAEQQQKLAALAKVAPDLGMQSTAALRKAEQTDLRTLKRLIKEERARRTAVGLEQAINERNEASDAERYALNAVCAYRCTTMEEHRVKAEFLKDFATGKYGALVVPAGRSLGSCGRGRGRPSSVGRAPRLALIKLQSLRVWPAASRWRAFHLAVGTSGISGKNAVAFECQQMW